MAETNYQNETKATLAATASTTVLPMGVVAMLTGQYGKRLAYVRKNYNLDIEQLLLTEESPSLASVAIHTPTRVHGVLWIKIGISEKRICAAFGYSIIIGHGTIVRRMGVTFIENFCPRFA